MTLRFRLRVLFHLLQHFFLGQALFATRLARSMAFMIIILLVTVSAKTRSAGVLRVHLDILLADLAMHHGASAHNR